MIWCFFTSSRPNNKELYKDNHCCHCTFIIPDYPEFQVPQKVMFQIFFFFHFFTCLRPNNKELYKDNQSLLLLRIHDTWLPRVPSATKCYVPNFLLLTFFSQVQDLTTKNFTRIINHCCCCAFIIIHDLPEFQVPQKVMFWIFFFFH